MKRLHARTRLMTSGMVLLALAACTPYGELLVEHRAAEARWEAQEAVDYRYRFRRLCECAPDALREVWITVSREMPVNVTFVDDGSQVPQENWTDYPTVWGLFAEIAGAARASAHAIQVEYDPVAGYPLSIDIDRFEGMADEEIIWRARDLQKISP